MKKITLLLAMCVTTVMLLGYPQTLPIDYSSFFGASAISSTTVLEKGTYLTSTDAIMANQWNRSGKLTSGEGGGSSPLLENNTLSYSNYVDNNVGKAIILDPNITTGTIRSTIYSLTASSLDYTDKAFYVGMLVNFSAVVGSGVDFFAFDANHTANSQRGRIFVKASTNSGYYNMGIGWGGTSEISAWSGDLAIGTTYFIVAKMNPLSVSGNESIALYINPTIGATEASATLNNSGSYAWAFKSIKGLTIRQRPGIGGKISSIRFSDNWADVVKPASAVLPALPSPTVGTASSVNANGFNANWTSVANAVGYDVKVYLGANLVSTTNVSGQTSESAAITGLMSGLTYTYKVVAKGDITNFSDSEPSAASADITTLDPYASNTIHTDFGDVLTWGTPAESQPASGTYPSSSINGFDLSAAVLYVGSTKGLNGETHTNRIAIDKGSNGGKVTLPTVNSVEQIEIHATAGTAGNGFQLKEFNPSTNTWTAIGDTYVYDANTKNAGTDSIYIISLSRSVPTKFRIENPTNGGIYILQIITRTTNPALLAKPTVGEASGVNSTGFTANWTAVANATGYKVFVYQGTTLISGAPFTVNGQALESLSINDLEPETAYTFKVQAIGDGDVSFSDSYLSIASVPVTTSIGTSLEKLNNSNFAIVTGKEISLSETGNISIFNLQGSLVYQAKIVNAANTNLASGMYIVNFTNASGKKLIQKISIK